MQLARVLGEVVATMKDVNLTGSKLLVVQPDGARWLCRRPNAGGDGFSRAPE